MCKTIDVPRIAGFIGVIFLTSSVMIFARKMSASDQPVSSQVSPVTAVASELRAIQVEEDPEVPGAAKPLLKRLKAALSDEFLLLLSESPPHRSAEMLSRKMKDRLIAQGVKIGLDENDIGYGAISGLEIRGLTGLPDWMAFTPTLAIPCGEDSVLFLYHRVADRWELALQKSSDDYDEISGAQGSFQYRVSPPDKSGNFFVVTASISPWCQSNWQLIRFQAMRPGASPEQPVLLTSGESGIYIGVDEPLRITTGREGFVLKFSDWSDPDLHHRLRILTYRVDQTVAKRIGPIAHNPQDFLYEWFNLDWAEARHWVTPKTHDAIRSMHRRFHEDRKDWYTLLPVVQPCHTKPASWLLQLDELELAQSEPELSAREQSASHYYLSVTEKRPHEYFITAVYKSRPRSCPGDQPPVPSD